MELLPDPRGLDRIMLYPDNLEDTTYAVYYPQWSE